MAVSRIVSKNDFAKLDLSTSSQRAEQRMIRQLASQSSQTSHEIVESLDLDITEHVIQEGEYLSTIADKYGITTEELYNANREVIGDNPNLIFPGIKLVIPNTEQVDLVEETSTESEETPVTEIVEETSATVPAAEEPAEAIPIEEEIEETLVDDSSEVGTTVHPRASMHRIRTVAARATTPHQEQEAFINDAKQYVGSLPYVYGGNSLTSGTDCSGFVQLLYHEHGYDIGRTVTEQSSRGSNPPGELIQMGNDRAVLDELLPGDLIMITAGGESYGHIVMYAGEEDGVPYIIHEVTQSKDGTYYNNVAYEPLSDRYIDCINEVRRIIPEGLDSVQVPLQQIESMEK